MTLGLFKIQNGRMICGILVIVDIILGGLAIFFPHFYVQIFHPNLETFPFDFIARTGVLWLIFALIQFIAMISKNPKQWFFTVGLIRLMEVPADIVYGILAIGASLISRLMIFSAPILNFIIGIYLYLLSKNLDSKNDK